MGFNISLTIFLLIRYFVFDQWQALLAIPDDNPSESDHMIEIISALIGLLSAIITAFFARSERGRKTVETVSKEIKKRIPQWFSRRHPPSDQNKTKAILCGMTGEFAGTIVELDEHPLVIGRDPRVAQLIYPPDVKNISKRHCAIRYDPQRRDFSIEDCWSTNGTFLNSGAEIEPGRPMHLSPGSQFFLSDRINLFEVNFEKHA